jgi:hypothetical protein
VRHVKALQIAMFCSAAKGRVFGSSRADPARGQFDCKAPLRQGRHASVLGVPRRELVKRSLRNASPAL